MKKILPFIIILSLLVPFLPPFDFTLNALPYTPSESENSWIEDLQIKFQTYLGNNGVVVNSDWYNRDYVGGFWNDVLNYFGFEKIEDKDYASSLYDYSIINNLTADMIFNDSSQYVENKVEDLSPYVVRHTYHVNDLLNLFFPYSSDQGQYTQWYNRFNLIKTFVNENPDNIFFFQNTFNNLASNPSLWYSDLDDFISSNYAFYCTTTPDDSYMLADNGFLRLPDGNPLNVPGPNKLWIINSEGVLDSYSFLSVIFTGAAHGNPTASSFTASNSQIRNGFMFFINNATNVFNGTLLMVADTQSNFNYPVFYDIANATLFYSGSSPVYKFDSSVDLGQYGDQIDYSRLYDLISDSVANNTGNVIDNINNVADKYLQQQLDLLHDINNALNDGNGQSWLRRIYGILDYNFPLTLDAFDDLLHAVQNISVSGGGDFSEATQVLHEIDTKLGILIDEPFTDLTDSDWNNMKSRIQTKFPFCIFSDIVAISVILNRPPQQPDLNFLIPIIGSESENVVHIDLSPYEHARPYVHGALIFIFIIGLLALSVKIFDHLKS